MIGTSLILLCIHGIASKSELKLFNFGEISNLFGGTVFIFICHHSISGIVYPIRP